MQSRRTNSQRSSSRPTGRAVLICAVLVVAFAAGTALAQSGKKSGEIRVNDVDSGSVDLGVTEIEGRIFKPSVFFVLARSDWSYKGLSFKQDFADRIVLEALKRPF